MGILLFYFCNYLLINAKLFITLIKLFCFIINNGWIFLLKSSPEVEEMNIHFFNGSNINY